MTEAKKNPIVTLKAQAKEFDFNKLRADKKNISANSGETMYLDFPRMNFVINGKSIDKILTSESIEGYKKQYAWKVHLQELPTLKDRSKTFCSNQDYDHLFSKKGDGNKHYRSFAKEVFKQIFGYAGAAVPNDSILEELTTHCNQSGYVGSLLGDESKPLTKISFEHDLNFQSIGYAIYINCDDTNRVTIRVKEPISVRTIENPQEEMHMDSSLKFTLEFKDGVTYRDGKFSLTVPEKLKNYQDGKKSLLDIIKEYFQKFCERLGLKFEANTQIKRNLGNRLKVDSHLESVEPPVRSNGHVHGS